MLSRLRPRLTFANVISLLALFVALGGTGYAALKLPKNSVGTKQLKNRAVRRAKLANQAVTGSKVANHSLTGVQVDAATLGTVHDAMHATNADRASSAEAVAAPEGWHEVGAAAEPGFQNGWIDSPSTPSLPSPETVAFYKDREGVVHLKGQTVGGPSVQAIFQLPAGYRPASGKVLQFAAPCGCEISDSNGDTVAVPTGRLSVFGSGFGIDGSVVLQTPLSGGGTKFVNLDGITFRSAG
jgi:hypothetical protein